MVLAALNTIASLFYYLRWIAPAMRAVFATRTPAGPHATDGVLRAPAAVASVLLGIGAGRWLAIPSEERLLVVSVHISRSGSPSGSARLP